MFGEEGEGSTVKPIYQILMEWSPKPNRANVSSALASVTSQLNSVGFDKLGQWNWDPGPGAWKGAMLFEGKNLEDYYFTIKQLRDAPSVRLDYYLQCKFTIGRTIYTGIKYEIDPPTIKPRKLTVQFYDEGSLPKGEAVVLMRWQTLSGNRNLANVKGPLGEAIMDKAGREGFRQVSYNLTSFSSRWDGWRLFRGERGTGAFTQDVVRPLQLTNFLHLEVLGGVLDGPDFAVRTGKGNDGMVSDPQLSPLLSSKGFKIKGTIGLSSLATHKWVFAHPQKKIGTSVRGAIIRTP